MYPLLYFDKFAQKKKTRAVFCRTATVVCYCFRLDRYRGDPKQEHKDSFDFECHIYVDDAFMTEEETGKRLVNSYVNDLTRVVIEVYR